MRHPATVRGEAPLHRRADEGRSVASFELQPRGAAVRRTVRGMNSPANAEDQIAVSIAESAPQQLRPQKFLPEQCAWRHFRPTGVTVGSGAAIPHPMISTSTLSDRRGLWAFVLGVILVTGGVLLHAADVPDGPAQPFPSLVGMPIGWRHDRRHGGDRRGVRDRGLRAASQEHCGPARRVAGHRRNSARGCAAERPHWRLMVVLVVALVIDVMKPATLGFTLPGMMNEYQVDQGDGLARCPSSRWSARSSARSSGASSPIFTAARRRSCCRR